MAVRIRLKRMGGKNEPFFRVVVTDKHSPRDGRFIEEIGVYNPRLKKDSNYKIDVERANQWIAKGALPSDTVRSILKRAAKQKAAA
jgi:small subunit ribosomal protein S16